uniref:Uncharacterized protein n=1 Tax=Panagrolaimus sp. ES5 TaxID=591445 RepID=A0AC34FIP3_9BILA
MFYRIKYSILWLLIVTLTLSEASNRIIASRKDGVCDEDCMLSKSNIHGKNKSIKFKPRSNPQTRTCSIQGIDTSASSEEPFQLFDISNQQYNIAYLTQPGGICECSSNVKEAKHAVIKTITSRKDGFCDEGIDTSASEEPFQLFDISNQQYDIAHLTQSDGICDCSNNVKEAKHAVIKKELDGRIVLTDAYILCGEDQNNEQVLEELMFDYIKNVPERTLGSKPNIKKDDEYCLDENGFIT